MALCSLPVTGALLGAIVCAGCATAPATLTAPAYRGRSLAPASPFAGGECWVTVGDFSAGKFEPKADAHMPKWARHAKEDEDLKPSLSPNTNFGDTPNYHWFMESGLYQTQKAFSGAVAQGLIETRKSKGAPHTGMTQEARSHRRQYELHAELLSLQPPSEDPPAPMKMTFLIEMRAEKGPPIESIEVDVTTPQPDFGGAGKQMAEQFVPYMTDRLGCWTSWQ